MTRRQGTTLIEVLVAIFVMGIGLIALLTLFPLGALRMAQAIQDDRCATAVVNANAIATMKNIRNDPSVSNPPGFPVTVGQNAFTDIFSSAVLGPPVVRPLAADPNGPSYPVYVDPIGYVSQPRTALPVGQQKWLADGAGGNYPTVGLIARTPTSFTAPVFVPPPGLLGVPKANIFKWFSLLDDYLFDSEEATGGQVTNFNPPNLPFPLNQQPAIRRDTRYTWAYLIQRPRSSDPSIATCAVVVYKQRPLSLSAGQGNFSLPEAAYRALFNVTTNTITLDWTNAAFPPTVNVGDWLLDTTQVTTAKPSPPGLPSVTYGSAHGYFYRVVGVSTPGATGINSADYEVQQPIRGFPAYNPNLPLSATNTPQPPGGVIVLEGVGDVYDRGLDRKFD